MFFTTFIPCNSNTRPDASTSHLPTCDTGSTGKAALTLVLLVACNCAVLLLGLELFDVLHAVRRVDRATAMINDIVFLKYHLEGQLKERLGN